VLASLGLALLLQWKSVLDDFGAPPDQKSKPQPIRLVVAGTVAPALLVGVLALVHAGPQAIALAGLAAPAMWLMAFVSARSTKQEPDPDGEA
jgi:hypothetical protein